MNKVFQHAGDLVNPKVAHNLMRLIAEGFGEDDDTEDSLLRLSAVCNSLFFLNFSYSYISILFCCDFFFWFAGGILPENS